MRGKEEHVIREGTVVDRGRERSGVGGVVQHLHMNDVVRGLGDVMMETSRISHQVVGFKQRHGR